MKDSQQKISHKTMTRLMKEQTNRFAKTGEKTSIKDLIAEAVENTFKVK